MSGTVFMTMALILFASTVALVIWPVRKLVFSGNASVSSGTYRLAGDAYGEIMQRKLVKAIDSAQDVIRMVSGECSTLVFSPEVGAALRRAVGGRRVKVKIICGPVMTVRNTDSSSVILELAKEGVIELYISKYRSPIHFRTIDDDRCLYWEERHPFATDPMRRYRCAENSAFEQLPFVRDFKSLLDAPNVRRSSDPANDFVLVREDEIDLLRRQIVATDKDLDEMRADEIRTLLERVRLR